MNIISPSGTEGYESDPEIMGVTSNSKEVHPGFLVAALLGSNFDGSQFISEAIARGAVAILINVSSDVFSKPMQVHTISTDNPRRLFALISAKFLDIISGEAFSFNKLDLTTSSSTFDGLTSFKILCSSRIFFLTLL